MSRRVKWIEKMQTLKCMPYFLNWRNLSSISFLVRSLSAIEKWCSFVGYKFDRFSHATNLLKRKTQFKNLNAIKNPSGLIMFALKAIHRSLGRRQVTIGCISRRFWPWLQHKIVGDFRWAIPTSPILSRFILVHLISCLEHHFQIKSKVFEVF